METPHLLEMMAAVGFIIEVELLHDKLERRSRREREINERK